MKNATLKRQVKSFEFRKEPFNIFYHTWVDEEEKEEYTTTALDELNLAQLHNKYRNKYNIPFVDEIKAIREQYGLTASKRSEILGLGPNVDRNYENGEMPSVTTGRLIQFAKDPEEFKKMIELSRNELEPAELEKINRKVESKLTNWNIGEKLGNLKTSEIVNVSHNEIAWTQNIDEHGRISYDYGFVLETLK